MRINSRFNKLNPIELRTLCVKFVQFGMFALEIKLKMIKMYRQADTRTLLYSENIYLPMRKENINALIRVVSICYFTRK